MSHDVNVYGERRTLSTPPDGQSNGDVEVTLSIVENKVQS